MAITRQSLTSSEENFQKNYKRAGIKVLREVMMNEMGFDLEDVEGYTKPELIDIINDYMSYNKGGMARKKTKGVSTYSRGGLTRSGHTDHRARGLFK